jgi:hypothetical protein
VVQAHVAHHTGYNMHVCPKCSKRFTLPRAIQKHMRTAADCGTLAAAGSAPPPPARPPAPTVAGSGDTL